MIRDAFLAFLLFFGVIATAAACAPAEPKARNQTETIMFAECMNKGLDYYKNVPTFPHTVDPKTVSYPSQFLISTVVKDACDDNSFSFGQLSMNPDVVIVAVEPGQ